MRLVVLPGLREKRALRCALMDLACAAAAGQSGALLLPDPIMTDDTLGDEWRAFEAVLKPSVSARLQVVARRKGTFTGWPCAPTAEERERFNSEMDRAEPPAGVVKSVGKRSTFHDILRLLIRGWMSRRGAIAQGELVKEANCSYPTIATALKKLDAVLQWEGARRVYLTRFPSRDFERILALAPELRGSRYFIHAQGMASSPQALGEYVTALKKPGLALGGVLGALHHLPSLNLTAAPRVDVTVKAASAAASLDWVRELGLREATCGTAAAMAIHFIHFPSDGFLSAGGVCFADPVECLLDLHELGLETQVGAFLEHFQRAHE